MAKSICVVSCLILWFTCLRITPIKCTSNETDLLALLAFKAAINADPLGALNSWNETSDFCTWNGVHCSKRHRSRVVAIGLVSKGLVGSLSPHIGNLSFLRAIALRNNSFSGQIPQQVGFLRRLEFVELSNNSFVGPIPTNISQCSNLVYLNLIDNSLSGTIPFELGYLYRLTNLGLGKNNLSGSIPPAIGNLTSLRQISLGSCDFVGEIPESFSQLRNLNYLFSNVNRLSGTIPSGLFNLSGLSYFEVALNQLEGTIPANMGLTLPNLKRFYLAGNMFSGKIPISLANATLLEDLDFTANSFHGPLPEKLGSQLPNIITFLIEANLIRDDISFISSFTNCTNLTTLVVSKNFFSGSLPDSIANLSTNMIWLRLSENQIHGQIHPGIRNLVRLTRLSLNNNFLSGPIPFSIGELSNLRELYLGTNRLTEKIPYSLGNLTSLNRLELQENNLSGSIPPSLSRCTNLLSLSLSDNNLNGSVPEDIMRLSSLSIFLDLSNNAFTGSIPDDVGSLVNLAYLGLSDNSLSGQIPNSLSHCTSLQGLYLQGNLLQGEIPPDLSALRGLLELDLSRNNLSGKIPVVMVNLTDLENLNLSFNRLQGEVPTQGVFRNRTAVSLYGNKELCGGVPELKLPPCSSPKPSKENMSTLKKILIPVAGGIGFAFALCFLIYIYRRKMTIKNPSSLVASFIGAQFMRLSYTDLLKATGGFSEENLIGAGRFGSVYKGILEDGQKTVAVKVLNLFVRGASKSFVAECNALKGLKHRNLLKILSVCDSVDYHQNEFKALVYEFQANGSLEKWLHWNREQEEHDAVSRSLDMIERLKIAIDVANALEYLHVGSDSTIVHGDVKPSNILLDQDMNAHVGDFGLVKIVSSIVPSHQNSNSIAIKGTVGYVPPEYGTGGSFSTEGDVYSYGILLLEMFTNKKPIDDEFCDGVNLHSLVSNALPDRAMEMVDPLMIVMENEMTDKKKECVVSVLHIGVGCSREAPRDRMLMSNVVGELCKIRDVLLVI